MKRPIALISNDWHLEENNADQVISVILQKIEYYNSLQDKNVRFICLGDVFDSRKSQKEATLLAFNRILDLIHDDKIVLDCIPGNHDKTDYNSLNSYLDVFYHHPALNLYNDTAYFQVNGIRFLFQPFISEDKWIQSIEQVKTKKTIDLSNTVLLSHIAVNGSINNDNTKVESRITKDFLSDFRLILLGHYHNTHQVSKNIIHLPSIRQKNFGEDKIKGFTVLYDDFSYEIIKCVSKEYITLTLDASKVNSETINDIIDEFNKNKDNVNLRVEFRGSVAEAKSLYLSKLKANGIKLKFVFLDNNQEHKMDLNDIEIVDFESNEKIIEAFKDFCEDRSINVDEGMVYLKQVLQ